MRTEKLWRQGVVWRRDDASTKTNDGALVSGFVIIAALPVVESLLGNEELSSEEVRIPPEACRRHGNAWAGFRDRRVCRRDFRRGVQRDTQPLGVISRQRNTGGLRQIILGRVTVGVPLIALPLPKWELDKTRHFVQFHCLIPNSLFSINEAKSQ